MHEQRLTIRNFLAGAVCGLAPSCADTFGATIIERLGFELVHLSGHAVHKSIGLPDAGLITLSEVESRILSIVEAVGLPLVVDGETGFGNVRNMRRTIRLLERAGASAIHVEDQVTPRLYRETGTVPTISAAEMVDKLKAALDERKDESLVLIARCEDRTSDAELIERLVKYAETGVDALWTSGFGPEILEPVRQATNNVPFVGIYGDQKRAAELGIKIAVFPSLGVIGAAWGMMSVLGRLRDGTPPDEIYRALDGLDAARSWFRTLGQSR